MSDRTALRPWMLGFVLAAVLLGTEAQAARKSASNLYQRTVRGTVLIKADQGNGAWNLGSGWLADRSRKLIVTNYHVADAADTVDVYFPAFQDGELITSPAHYRRELAIRGRVVDSDLSRDLAIVQLESVPAHATELKLAERSPGPGERLHLVGNPAVSQSLWVYSTGVVRTEYQMNLRFAEKAYTPRSPAMALDVWVIESDVASNSGDSGGPVVNDQGEVVGTHFRRGDGRLITHHVHVNEVRDLLAEVRDLLDSAAATADHYYRRAERFEVKKRSTEALADYSRAIEMNPKHAEAYRDRGYVYYWKEDYASALADCNKALKLNPQDALAYNYRGLARGEMEQYRAAVEDFTRALQLNPELATAYHHRGQAYYCQDQFDRAIKDFTEALRLDPANGEAFHWRGFVYYKQGKYDQALLDLAIASRACPTDGEVHHWLGATLEARGQFTQAQEMFEKAIQLDPKWADESKMFEERFLKVANQSGIKLRVCVRYETFTQEGKWEWFPSEGGASWTLEHGESCQLVHEDWKVRARRIQIWAENPKTGGRSEIREAWLAEKPYRGLERQKFTYTFTQ